ncbi:MAG: hypothetical protein IJU76_02765 [Desulfovibrionaceae bacterium]|nr:hypothetical protein [Desulfovibrionaceae bacterium]
MKKRLESVLQRIIENLNHRLTAKILLKQLSLGSLRDLIEKDVIRTRDKKFSVAELLSKEIQLSTLQGINEEKIIQWLSLRLHVRDESIFIDNKTVDGFLPISQEAAAYLERELIRLDILVPFTVRKIYDDASVIDSKRNLLVQHGLKFCQETAMAECLTNDLVFVSLFKSDKDSLLHRMEQDILGHIIEEIILLDTQKSFENSEFKVFTLGLPKGEVDLAILDTKTMSIALFEIKHSSAIDPDHQDKYLKDNQIVGLIKKAFGWAEIVERSVLINNNSISSKYVEGIHYQSLEIYLKNISKDQIYTVFGNK